MVRKIRFFFLITVLLLHFFCISGYAQEEVRIEQVQVNLPEVAVYYYLPDVLSEELSVEPETVTASLNRNKLEPEAADNRRETEPVHYYFLVDCSTSTRAVQMEAVKETLLSFADSMEEQDTMSLITFGLTVDTVLRQEGERETIKAAIDNLKADQKGTLFFDAIAKTRQLVQQKEMAGQRKVAFIFSDSIDVNLGGYTSQEISNLLSESSIPFYGLGFDTGTKEGLDGLGAVARQSGGQMEIVSDKTLKETFTRMYQDSKTVRVVRFQAKSNRIEASLQPLLLEIEKGGQSFAAERQVLCRYWKPDTKAPQVLTAVQVSEQSVEITFDETVSGASDIASFKLLDAQGKEIPVLSAAYDRERRSVLLTVKGPLSEGGYVLELSGITDESMEENPFTGNIHIESAEFIRESEAGEADGAAAFGQGGNHMAAWYLLTIASAAIVVAMGVSAIKKKNRRMEEQEEAERDCIKEQLSMPEDAGIQVRFTAAPPSEIRLQVLFQNGESQMLLLPLRGTLFVGRSEICDVCFDDRDMSRQHFVIEEKGEGFAITNLSETNGTRVNGILLKNPRTLKTGDVIEAGQERITFIGGGETI